MVGIESAPGWKHKSGYHLHGGEKKSNAGGDRVSYQHEDGAEIFIEFMREEEVSKEEREAGRDYSFWGLLKYPDGSTEGPVRFTFGAGEEPKAAAISWMEQSMKEYSSA